jgi:hypothetical protein
MPAIVLSMGDLALRIAAAWEAEYKREHVPDNTQRQEFIGGCHGVKDETPRSHEMMPKLVTKLDRLAKEMLLASDADLVPLRHDYKETSDCMKGRNRYFKKYFANFVVIHAAGFFICPCPQVPMSPGAQVPCARCPCAMCQEPGMCHVAMGIWDLGVGVDLRSEPRCGCGWWLVREINKQGK